VQQARLVVGNANDLLITLLRTGDFQLGNTLGVFADIAQTTYLSQLRVSWYIVS
jgi:hypothetical protein